MPRFMLDTDTCCYTMKRSHPLVLKRLQAVPVGDVCMSVVTKAELLYGAEVSRAAHRMRLPWRHSCPMSMRWSSTRRRRSTTLRFARTSSGGARRSAPTTSSSRPTPAPWP